MPRRPRIAPGGLVYHVLNGAVARLALFEKEADYAAFERVLVEALQETAEGRFKFQMRQRKRGIWRRSAQLAVSFVGDRRKWLSR